MPEGNTEKAGSPESGDPHSGPAPLWTAPRLEERGHEVSLLNEWSDRGAGALSRTSGSSLARAISVSFTPPAHCSDFWNCHVSLERDSCYLWSNKSGDMSVCSAGSISMAGVRVGLRSRTHRHVWLWRSGFIYSGKRGGHGDWRSAHTVYGKREQRLWGAGGLKWVEHRLAAGRGGNSDSRWRRSSKETGLTEARQAGGRNTGEVGSSNTR